MKINFAPAANSDIDMFGDDNLFGPDENGVYYYNAVEFGTNPGGLDEVTIHDTCNRYMPITVDSIPGLIQALSEFYNLAQQLESSKVLKSVLTSNLQAYVVEDVIEYDQSFQ